MLRIIVPYISVFLFFTTTSYSQDVSFELKRINASYHGKSVALDLTYVSYITHTAPNPLDQITGKYVSSSNTMYQELDGVITYKDPSYIIQVDPSLKTVTVDINAPINQSNAFLPVDFDMLKTKVVLKEMKSGLKRMDILPDSMSPLYEKVSLIYHSKDYSIKKAILYYSEPMVLDEEKDLPEEKPRLEILFTPSTDNAAHYLKNVYVLKKGDKLFLTEKYKEYVLSDLRQMQQASNKEKNKKL